MESDVLRKMRLGEIILRKVGFGFGRVVYIVRTSVLNFLVDQVDVVHSTWNPNDMILVALWHIKGSSVHITKFFLSCYWDGGTTRFTTLSENHADKRHLFMFTGAASICTQRITAKTCRCLWLQVNPTTGICCARPSADVSIVQLSNHRAFPDVAKQIFGVQFQSGRMWKAANEQEIQVGLIKTGELLQVHWISEVLTEKEKNTTVSHSDGLEREKKILSTSISWHFPPRRPEEVLLRRPPAAISPFSPLSFISCRGTVGSLFLSEGAVMRRNFCS